LPADPVAYVERRTGRRLTDPIYASAFLDWCYNTPSGKALTRGVLSRRVVSQLYGWYYRQPWTRRKIASFAQKMGVDITELTQPVASFRSFADFIARPIDLARRPIDRDPATCVAPADGRLLAYPAVAADTSLRIKGGLLDRASLLADAPLARRFAGGTVVLVRLYLADYHHFHFPDAGTPREPKTLAGRYYAVTPYARDWIVPFCTENHRVVTCFDSVHFGTMGMVEVGAFTVGSVRQDFMPGRRVAKGAHKGSFELGGSLVVLLFEPGTIRLDDDLCANTRDGVETRVRMGEAIGRSLLPS
jgi:phosphatidylserine decarboxylase